MATRSQWTREHHPGAKPGRRKGSKNKIPGSVKALILGICEEIVTENPELIRRALIAGFTAKPPRSLPYLKLVAHYLDGKPREHVPLAAPLDARYSEAAEAFKAKLARLAAAATPAASMASELNAVSR